MKRLARVVAVGVPHHVTQRGNGRQFFAEAVRSRWASPGPFALNSEPARSVY